VFLLVPANPGCPGQRAIKRLLCVVVVAFWDHPGEPVPEDNFCTLWCKGRLTEADTPTIWLGATPCGLTSAHLHHPPYILYLSLYIWLYLENGTKWRHRCGGRLTRNHMAYRMVPLSVTLSDPRGNFLITGSIARSASRRYLVYSEADF